MQELSVTEQRMLDFEQQRWKYTGAKDRAIQEEFGMSPISYYHRLTRLIDQQAALAYAPMLVKRLRNARTTVNRA